MLKDKLITILLTLLSVTMLLLSTAGFGASFLVFFGFIPLFFAIRRNNINPLLLGWLVGFIYWMVGLSWMMITFTHFGNAPVWGALGLLLFISLSGGFFFFAPFTYVARKYGNQPLILALVFIALEAAKGALFFGGVPWLNLAQSQYKNLHFIQTVSFVGEYGLSFIIMLVNIYLFYILVGHKRDKSARNLIIVFIILILPAIYNGVFKPKVDGNKNILVVQTGFSQEDKWNRDMRLDLINMLNNRLMDIKRGYYDLIVLPESSYPASVLDTPFITDVVQDIAFDTPLLLGTDTRSENIKLGKLANYNSMVLFDDTAQPKIYNKRQLTPFGEYFPLEKLLYPMRVFFFGKGELFTAGTEAKVFDINGMKIAPIICWEGAFSDLVRDTILNGANMIAVISNDSWFGKSSGRYQHFAVDVVRAVEYQRSMVRSTQDGISAIILPNGKDVATVKSPQYAEISYSIPLVSEKSIFTKIGYSYLIIIAIVSIVLYKRSKKEDDN